MRTRPSCSLPLLRPAAFALSFGVVLLGLGACQTTDLGDITGALGGKSEKPGGAASDPRAELDQLRERFRAAPNDPDVSLRYGSALRATGQRSQAVAVLEQATIANPGNKALLAAYGRALADNGNFQQAFDVLSRAHSPEDPDWRILSAQGAALDQMGRNEEARQYYVTALKIAPDDPSVLSNLGLSYALSNELPKAEEQLRKASANPEASPRVRTNLAVIVGLQGRMSEAESIARTGLPPEQANANVAYVKKILVRRQMAQRELSPRHDRPVVGQPDKALAKALSRSDD
ncbi:MULTISPECIES: tetratricopeptide repeat protein [Bradyrhizobium]|uniref:Tetratricopeptide repeat protein n=1 Tax=Bradyrhizobium aeschynomenes TaxID=2734909 RepID=A0ABX2CHD0_9BRAD|nr:MULTISPECIES: tetratricopeptide repeat protein [Bradyrhizobium]NPU67621.1 tetratricopeptide repeat protein [Bradyrhizobium aeschynomenes]